jgi:hypothetical protein
MITDDALGMRVAENSDEKFFTELKEKCEEALKAEARNIKINQKMLELCAEELSVN